MAPVAYAHTMDKSTLFTDVPETAANIQDIMVLHSIGLLGYNGKDMALNPTDNLSRKDFAGWVGGFFGLEGATVDELAQAAQKEDYVSSLEGDITYKEINTALFHHKLELANPDATMTKEEYIAFLTEHLTFDMGGQKDQQVRLKTLSQVTKQESSSKVKHTCCQDTLASLPIQQMPKAG